MAREEQPKIEPTFGFAPAEIVVDLPYRSLVTQVLRDLEPSVHLVGGMEDRTLGLARLSLSGVEAYAAAHSIPKFDGAEPLDAVLSALRTRLSLGQWVVEVGKNRDMHGVTGFPQSKPLGYDDPVPADPSQVEGPKDKTAGNGVRVGVLDTKFYSHPDFGGHLIADHDDLLADAAATPASAADAAPAYRGHGTFVAGLIAARAPAATIVARAVLSQDTGRASAWATAVAMANFDDVAILNCSLGCRTRDNLPPLVMRRAIDVLRHRMVVVAAAGNHQTTDYATASTWPAALPGVLAVGAADDDHFSSGVFHLAKFSPQLPWVACVAPGKDVASTYLNGWVEVKNEKDKPIDVEFHGYARWSGTSFSAATVTGAIAAGTVPGWISAQEALYELLSTPNRLVTRYPGGDDKGRA